MPDVDPITLEVVKNALGVDRGRDGTRDHAQRVLARRPRHVGLFDRALRPQRPDRRAGPHARRAARDVPDRDGIRARGVRPAAAAGGRLHHQRPVRLRRPAPPRHLRDQAGLRRRRARGLGGDDGAPLRRRRDRARQHRGARDRDLPGGAPDPALEARRRAASRTRRCFGCSRRTPASRSTCSATCGRSSRPAGSASAG